jgi:hypothetical protein
MHKRARTETYVLYDAPRKLLPQPPPPPVTKPKAGEEEEETCRAGKETLLPDYSARHQDFTRENRGRLVDWLSEVTDSFSIKRSGYFLACRCLDMYFAAATLPVPQKDFQLVGIACLLIAAKFESDKYPPVGQFAYVSADTFTPRDVRRARVRRVGGSPAPRRSCAWRDKCCGRSDTPCTP